VAGLTCRFHCGAKKEFTTCHATGNVDHLNAITVTATAAPLIQPRRHARSHFTVSFLTTPANQLGRGIVTPEDSRRRRAQFLQMPAKFPGVDAGGTG
jgi:hypothetical protein